MRAKTTILLIVVSGLVHAEPKEVGNLDKRETALEVDRGYLVGVNPGSLLARSLTAYFHVAVADAASVGIWGTASGRQGSMTMRGGDRRGSSSSNKPVTEATERALGLELFYTPFNKIFNDGMVVEAFSGYTALTLKDKDTSYSTKARAISLGGSAGYGWFWDCGVTFNISFGLKYSKLSGGQMHFAALDGSDATLQTRQYSGFGTTGDLILGYAF